MASKKKTAAKKSPASASRTGVLGGGNWIIDQVKMIDVYPEPTMLANISGKAQQGTGGAPFNVLVDLSRLGAKFPLYAAGAIGKDELGDEILSICAENKIDTKNLKTTREAPTSYTDVMTETKGGRRTFFHNRGANALWDGGDLNFKRIKARIFHLGYLLLMDALDQKDRKHGTKAAALLAAAQEAGMKTSVDVVSEDSDRFAEIVGPALAHTDYCILNEIEAGKTTGFKLRDAGGALDTVACKHSAGALLQMGVGECVVIHFPEGGFARTRDGKDFWQSSLKLPKKYIAGSAGAGDAFCAGTLFGLHEGWDLQKCLFTGVCAAAASLSEPTCTDGVKSMNAAIALSKKYRPGKALEPDY